MSKLLTPYTINNKLRLKNNIAMSPMTTWASNDDYTISDQEVIYYQARNQSVGLVITGCTHIQANGIAFTHEFAGYDDKYLASLKKLANAAKSNGAPAILQINHGGNKALPELTSDIVSASPVPTKATAFAPSLTPRELSDDEIQEIIKAFGQTTRRAIEAGFDGVEIHGAHGFLIQQFLSPFFNKRTDKWGGNLENRMRFALEIVKEIKSVIACSNKPNFIVGYRISPDEPMEDGLKVQDTLALADQLIDLGIDYIHTSLFVAYETKAPNTNKTYVELFAERINGRTTLISAGTVQTAEQAQKVLNQGADIVAVGHALVTDPLWVEKAKSGEEAVLSIKKSQVSDLKLPDLLWQELQAMGDWFSIEE
ncbi:NADH-dependent flavin oxidoreductase [Streptococcus gallolyticus]|uniref:NADH-dependent flavin oxidoreductase n=1 Tax=Streptococcus gallolyticus TaxID=315405 RepID=UPI0034A39771